MSADQKDYKTVKEDRSEEGINTRLRELAEEVRNLRRNLEQDKSTRVPNPRAEVNDRSPRGHKKR